MRTSIPATATIAFWLMATSASAAPTISLVWTASSGTSSIGGYEIDARPGDVLRLTIYVSNSIASEGISSASISLGWTPGLITVGPAAECPGATSAPIGGNVLHDACTPTGFSPPTFLTPFAPGVVVDDLASTASSFDARVEAPAFTTGVLELGAIEFEPGLYSGYVDVFYVPGVDGVIDGAGDVFFPNASAYANTAIPEPTTAGLLALGLAALALQSASRRPAGRRNARSGRKAPMPTTPRVAKKAR